MATVVQQMSERQVSGRRVWPARRRAEFIEARVAGRLRRSPYFEVRHVACDLHEGMLCLRGRVTSYYMKQIAQTAVLGIDGVDEINNQLEVIAPPVCR